MREPASVVTLHLVDRVGLPPAAREEMMRQTTAPWRSVGVTTTWSSATSADVTTRRMEEPGRRPQVYVVVTPDAPNLPASGSAHATTMASILFADGRPTRMIRAYAGEVRRLLETARVDDKPLMERPALLRQRVMGRVLGRVIAHELGHFLFGSGDHTRIGLMRASHRLPDLMSPVPQPFRVILPPPRDCMLADARSAIHD